MFCLKQVKLLFAGERQLCDQVFECSQSLRDKCFSAITKNSLATLLSFGEAIAMSKRSPEKLFVLLDMYEIMCELQTEVHFYSDHACFTGQPLHLCA
jgi:exocyst complex protein 7